MHPMHPARSPAPTAMAATMLAVALAVALAAVDVSAAPRSIHSAAPWERVDEEVRQLYEAWKSKHPPWPPRGNDDDLLRLEVFRYSLRYIDVLGSKCVPLCL